MTVHRQLAVYSRPLKSIAVTHPNDYL